MMPDERLSMADQLGATWDKMEAEAPAEVVVDEPVADAPVETEEAKAERLRDEAGRFKADDGKDKPREKLTLKPKEAKDAAPKQERAQAEGKETGVVESSAKVGDVQSQPGAGSQPILPPANWSGKGKVEFERLPYHVKQHIVEEMTRAGEVGQKLGPVGNVIKPYEERFAREFGGTDRALHSILTYWQHARQSPVDFIRNFIQESRIDPRELGFAATDPAGSPANPGAEAYPPGQIPPEVQQRLAAIEGRFEQEAQRQAIQQQQQIHADIQAFGNETDKVSGALAHPYFNDVKVDMGALMAAGRAKTMQEAYDRACWGDPQIRAELQREAERKQAEQRKQAVAKARLAGGSVTGSPGVARSEAHVSQSVRADLLKNWDAQEARV